jgi:hypothetical protein
MFFERAVLEYFEIGFSLPATAGEAAAINPASIVLTMDVPLLGVTHPSFAKPKRRDKSGLDRDAENWKS